MDVYNQMKLRESQFKTGHGQFWGVETPWEKKKNDFKFRKNKREFSDAVKKFEMMTSKEYIAKQYEVATGKKVQF